MTTTFPESKPTAVAPPNECIRGVFAAHGCPHIQPRREH